jgi:branched-subunit amino acid ABC-type transport system permease component
VQFWTIQTLNGLVYGMLLFLLSAGLSLILGMMNVTNLAHGAFYLLASYIGYSVVRSTGSMTKGRVVYEGRPDELARDERTKEQQLDIGGERV